MIPRIFHRIYLDEPIPEEFEVYWERFRDLHPGWNFRTWDKSRELEWLVCREEFEQASTWAGKSDILRYELLYAIGGVYVDTDVEPLRPFDDLMRDPRPFIGWEDRNLLCPTVMGAPPHHPAIGLLLEQLPRWFRKYRNARPNRQTGPYFVTRFLQERTDVRFLDPDVFYPVHWSEKRRLAERNFPPNSLAVHHWAAGWLPDGPPQR